MIIDNHSYTQITQTHNFIIMISTDDSSLMGFELSCLFALFKFVYEIYVFMHVWFVFMPKFGLLAQVNIYVIDYVRVILLTHP